ncbi:flagellar biosynthesis protein FlhA [Proteinivorax hydrogeniformans]|uniref:Flagellar biosynthesis protein FlhA n=1 Tax=Proteinivorax hydrogeniformans TaxID=1826727 RepID=A0AAU8HQT6_9FIRM
MKIAEYGFVVIIILIIMMMIIPVHPNLLSILLVVNISLALTILLTTMQIKEPLEFAIFPSVLLLSTLFRLALNVSSTRLILNEADAGQVIEAFGDFVVGGNAAVGFIVFVILVIIQFIVITKGAERVAEVGARFTLDAMPGKQMAIDADLNAGLITEQEAKKRRKDIQREADFYGAMDGASKFVKGDAIAGIIITLINIGAGFAIGMITHGLDFQESMNTFMLLSVGDGLVSQIPALLISAATGITVTRAASEDSLGNDFIGQIFSNPKVMYIIAALLFFFAITPGLPSIPFIIIAALFLVIAYFSQQSQKKLEEEELAQQQSAATSDDLEEAKPESVLNLLQVDPLELEFGYGLISIFDAEQGGDLLDRVVMIRRQCAMDLGLVVPIVRIRDNIQLPSNEYVIKIKGAEVARAEIQPEKLMAMDPGTATEEIKGIDTIEPSFGLPALWISVEDREKAETSGYTVVDPPSIIATHLTEVIKQHGHELLGRQEVKTLLDNVKKTNSAVVEELVPNQLSIGDVQKVLCNLLSEGISIKDLISILEQLADYAPLTKDTDMLTEYGRQGLQRQISNQVKELGQPVPVITLDPQLEQLINDSIQQTDQGNYLSIDPENTQNIISNFSQTYEDLASKGYQPIVLTAPLVRLYFRKIIESNFPQVSVFSFNELDSKLDIQAVGVVKI